MSAIVIENGLVHYEVIGRGKPVIFLHGWLGSWRYWMGTMEALVAEILAWGERDDAFVAGTGVTALGWADT